MGQLILEWEQAWCPNPCSYWQKGLVVLIMMMFV